MGHPVERQQNQLMEWTSQASSWVHECITTRPGVQ